MTGRNGSRSTGAVVRRLKLGRSLRELREGAGLSVEVAAPQLDWSASKLSRIENGQQSVDVHGVRSMLDLYEAADRWKELIDLTRQTREKGWWRAYGLDDQGYVPLEAEASSVRDVTVGHIPGLLQTSEYARSIFLSNRGGRSDEQLEQELAVRMRRRERLSAVGASLALAAVIHEAALHHEVGGADVMVQQLEHLAEAAHLPSVTLQVLLFSVGAHPALSGGFILLNFGDLGVPDMAYVEHALGAIHIDKADVVARATLQFDQLRSLALDPEASVRLIEGVATRMR